MNKGTYVYCTTQFEWFHRWPDASSDVPFLRNLHRHMFHVRFTVKVKHKDRAVEFIGLKRNIDEFINRLRPRWPENLSCEMIAQILIDELHKQSILQAYSCEVSEDGENGAIVVCQ